MSVEQRRAKLRELKPKSKSLRCGGMGHWAGDPGCKFANKPQPPKPAANLAYESESPDDEGFVYYVGAATSAEQTNAAMMAFRSGASGKGSRPRPSQAQSSMVRANDATSSDSGARVTPLSVERSMGLNNVFQIGQFKGKTYWDVLHRQPQFYMYGQRRKVLVFPESSSMCNGLTSSLSSGVERFTFVMNLFNLPLQCPVAPRKAQQRRRRLTRHCPTSARTARSFRSEGARDTRFVARVCVVGIRPPRKGKRNFNTSLKIVRVNPPITGDQAVRLIACGASNVVRSLNCQWNYAVSELPWHKLWSQQAKMF